MNTLSHDPKFFRAQFATLAFITLTACGGDGGSSSSTDSATLTGVYTLQVLHVSDMDSGGDLVNNAKALSALVKKFRAEEANTLFVSSGDNYIPGPFFNAADDDSLTPELGVPSAGRGDIGILNAMGLNASAFGNHEFDNGTRTVSDLLKKTGSNTKLWPGTQFPYLSANLDFSGDSNLASLAPATNDGADAATLKNQIAKYAVVTINGEKIGLVGATTPTLPAITTVGGVRVSPPPTSTASELAAVIQPSVDALTAKGINKIVLLAHMQQLAVEKALAPLLRDVDLIVAGGSNTGLYDENDLIRAGDRKGGDYPLRYTSAANAPILVVNVDADYKYLGRIVLTFDANGKLLPERLNSQKNGAWSTDTAGLARAGVTPADGLPAVATIADKIDAVIRAKDGNIQGAASVYLEGDRTFVRNRETNLGNLSADANLYYARQRDQKTAISLKNGGGIRSSIGFIDAPPGSTSDGIKAKTAANAALGKAAGDISQLDIEFSLKFNNSLTLLTLTAEQLKETLEHGVSDWLPNSTQGKFPQVGGLQFSFDPAKPKGERVQSIIIDDPDGDGPINRPETVYARGAYQVAQNKPYRTVTLSYLAHPTASGSTSGGDNYPLPKFAQANPGLCNQIDLVAPDTTMSFTTPGGEQNALAQYLKARHPRATPFAEADTATQPRRIQNLAVQ